MGWENLGMGDKKRRREEGRKEKKEERRRDEKYKKAGVEFAETLHPQQQQQFPTGRRRGKSPST